MRHHSRKTWWTALLAITMAVVSALWSWNTLAEWAGLPVAQFKHLLAAAVLLWLARAVVMPRPRQHRTGRVS